MPSLLPVRSPRECSDSLRSNKSILDMGPQSVAIEDDEEEHPGVPIITDIESGAGSA
jgi:hypothetical protein